MRLSTEVKFRRAGDDHVYVDICANSRQPSQERGAPQRASSSVTKTQPIIENPSEYYLSIIRFKAPVQAIPILIAPGYGNVVGGVRPRDALSWAVTIDYNSQASAETHLVWTPEITAAGITSSGAIIPPATCPPSFQFVPITPQNAVYFYMYSIQHFVDMLNVALQSAFTTASAFVGWPAGATIAPYVIFNPVTQLMTLIAQVAYISTAGTPIQIFFNSAMMDACFGSSLRNIYNGFPAVADENYWIQVLDYNGTNPATVNGGIGGAAVGYAMSQEFGALIVMSQFETLSFQSQTLPIVSNYGFSPIPLGGAFPGGPGTPSILTDSPLIPLVSDFAPASDNGTDMRNVVQYFPTAEYRLIELQGSAPIYTIDLSVYWSDNLGNLYPLYIPFGACVSAKIMFRKKKLGIWGIQHERPVSEYPPEEGAPIGGRARKAIR